MLWSVGLVVLGCAATPKVPPRPQATPTALEQALLRDAADRKLDEHSLLDAALIVSGVHDPERFAAIKRRLRVALDEVGRAVAGVADERKRAAALLVAMHLPTPGALLRSYHTKASTLVDVLEQRRFNCVSAAILYVIAAREAGLDARPVLLPSHARVSVHVGEQVFVVEPTSPVGFDPDERILLQQLYRIGVEPDPGLERVHLYGDARGQEVDYLALLGVVYTNESAGRTARGQFEIASALHERAELFVAPQVLPVVRGMRISTLNALGADLYDQRKYERAAKVLRRALDESLTEDSRALSTNNLFAAAQKHIEGLCKGGRSKAAREFVESFKAQRPIYDPLYAFLLATLAEGSDGDKDWAAMVVAIERARVHATTDDKRAEIDQMLAHARLNALQDLADRDPEQAWSRYGQLELDAADPSLAEHHRQAGVYIVATRCSVLAKQGRCDDIPAVAEDWQALDERAAVKQVRAACHAVRAKRLVEAEQTDKALPEQRRALELYPEDPAHRQNLANMLQQRISELVKADRCREIGPFVAEVKKLTGDTAYLKQAAEYCASSAGGAR